MRLSVQSLFRRREKPAQPGAPAPAVVHPGTPDLVQAPAAPAYLDGPVATVVRLDPAYRVARLTDHDVLDMSDPIAVLGDAVAMAEQRQATAAPGETYRVVAA